jgi:hypothetical protein
VRGCNWKGHPPDDGAVTAGTATAIIESWEGPAAEAKDEGPTEDEDGVEDCVSQMEAILCCI